MARADLVAQPAGMPAEEVEAQVDRVAAMNIDALRVAWSASFPSEPPRAFSKDLLARAIAHRVQEEAFGGLSANMIRQLRLLLKPGPEPARRVTAGSVVVREYKGFLHEVLVVPGGFCWRGQTFGSLSTIARKITGTSWSGPRFFGLRSKKPETPSELQEPSDAVRPSPRPRSGGPKSSVAGARRRGGAR